MTMNLLFNRTKDERKKKLCIAQRELFYYYIVVMRGDIAARRGRNAEVFRMNRYLTACSIRHRR